MSGSGRTELLVRAVRVAGRWASQHLAAWLGALVLVRVSWILARPLTYSVIHYDETFFLWGGHSILHGLVPYRDFQDFKPPVVFLTNALALLLFGLQRQHHHLFFTFLFMAAGCSIYFALIRRRVGVVLAFAATVLIVSLALDTRYHDANLDDAESIGLSFYMLGLAALLWGGRRAALANALGGALFVLSVLSKEPYALPVLATWVALGFAMRDHDPAAPGWRAYARQTIGGAAIASVAIFGYLAVTGGLSGYLGVVRAYGSFGDVCVRIGVAKPLTGDAAFDDSWQRLGKGLLNREQLLALLPFLTAFAVGRREGLGTRLATAAAVLVSLWAVTLGRCFFAHYFVMGLAGLILWTVLGARALRELGDGPARPWITLTALALVMAQVGPRYDAERKKKNYLFNDYVGYGSGVSKEVVDLVTANSAPTDRIQTDGSPGLYVFAGRRSVTKESAFLDEFLPLYPGATDEERLAFLRKKLLARPPKVLYLDPNWASRKKRHRAALLLPFIQELRYKDIGRGVYVLPP